MTKLINMPVPTLENNTTFSETIAPTVENHCTSETVNHCYGYDRGMMQDVPATYSERNVVFVQVNYGETFTVQGQDGSYRCISGPAQVPMVSPNGAIPPIYVPPGYVPHVIEENGMRRVVVMPSGNMSGVAEGQQAYIASPAVHHPHTHMPMHGMQQPHVHPGMFAQTVVPNCHPDGIPYFSPSMPHLSEGRSYSDLSDSGVSSLHQSSLPSTPSSDMHSASSPQPRVQYPSDRLQKKLLDPQASSSDSQVGECSMTSSPASSSSFTSSPSGSPKFQIPTFHQDGQQTSKTSLETLPHSHAAKKTHSLRVSNPTYYNSSYAEETPRESVTPSASPVSTDEDSMAAEISSHRLQSTSELQCYQTVLQLLSAIRKPEAVDVKPRSALIIWDFPTVELANPELKAKLTENMITFDLQFCNHKKEAGKFKSVYSGKDQKYSLENLRPASDYSVKVYAKCGCENGPSSESTKFRTPNCPPDKPLPPRLGARAKSTLLLKWNAPCDNGEKISKYHLELDEGNQDAGFRSVYSSSQKQFKVQKLLPDRSYFFRLAAENKLGKSAWSDVVSYRTAGTVPSTPDAPRLTKALVRSLTLSWVKPAGEVSGYTLEMNDESTGYGFQPVYNGGDMKYTVKDLVRSSHYKFRLLANNKEGKSKYSEVVSYLTCPDKPHTPGKPQVKGNVHARFFKLSWNAPKDNGGASITKYIMEMSREKGQPMEVVYSGIDQECLVENLEPGHSYRLRVFCFTNGGSSPPSDVAVVTTPPVIPGPCDPPMLAMRPKPTCLSIKWDPPKYTGGSVISHYEVNCSVASELDNQQPDDVYKGPGLDCTVGSLLPGTKYSFSVRAANKVGIGPWSARLEAVTSPGVPQKPRVPDATIMSSTSIHLQWEACECNGADITNYRLQWGPAAGEMVVHVTGPVLVYQLQRLIPNTAYYYSVQAVNSVGQSASSDVGCITTPPSCPDAVTNLRVMTSDDSEVEDVPFKTTSSSIAVEWDKPNDNGDEIVEYKIHVISSKESSSTDASDLSSAHKCLHEIDGAQTRFNIDDLSPDTEYSVKVCAANSIGCGCFSPPLKVRTKPTPPDAPELTCIQVTSNSIKLKWTGKSRAAAGTQYLLQMKDRNGRFNTIYRGSNSNYKASKLNENTDYRFRINASNSEGEGLFSPDCCVTTHIQAPSSVEAPMIRDVTSTSCHVTWPRLDPIKGDVIRYRFNLEESDQTDFKVVKEFPCNFTSYRLDNLTPGTEYRARVVAIRRYSLCRPSAVYTDNNSTCSETTDDGSDVSLLQGPYSAYSVFVMMSRDVTQPGDVVEAPLLTYEPEPTHVTETNITQDRSGVDQVAPNAETLSKSNSWAVSLSDERQAAIWLAVYFLNAIFLAFAMQFVFVK